MGQTWEVRTQHLPLLVRIVYTLLFGWWVSWVWIQLAWAANATVIGLPIGIWMLNRVPQVLSLKPTPRRITVRQTPSGTVQVLHSQGPTQYPWPIRLIYFLLIGWWASWLWANLGWILCVSIVGLPIGIWMFDRLPTVTTLARTRL